jgi:hypothetical protein
MSPKSFPNLRIFYLITNNNVKRTAVRTFETADERAIPACALRPLYGVVMTFQVRRKLHEEGEEEEEEEEAAAATWYSNCVTAYFSV